MTTSFELGVLLHGERVATIQRLRDDRNVVAFEPGYVEDPERPMLSLGFVDAFKEVVVGQRPRRTRLHPFFSNLLPEGALREYLARRAGVKPDREFFLLAVLGQDLPGAVTIDAPEVEEELGLLGAEGLGEVRDAPRPEGGEEALRFSLAGVQLKFSALAEAEGGLTLPARGVGGDWILKLPSMVWDAIPENEFSMLELARGVGIEVPRTRLLPAEGVEGLPGGIGGLRGMALAVERFDRGEDGERIHIEDFAQAFVVHPEEKYGKASTENLAELLWKESGRGDIEELVRRVVFSALIGNADAHLKNFSLIYRDRRRPALAPAYDLVSTIPFLPEDRKLALSVGGVREMRELTWERLERFVAKVGLPREAVLRAAAETVERFREVWGAQRGALPLPEKHAEAIDAHLATVPLANDHRPD